MTTPSIDDLAILLGSSVSQPGFEVRLYDLVGDYEKWDDEGDTFYTGLRSGVEVMVAASGLVSAVFVFGPGSEGRTSYVGQLPLRLTFKEPRAAVRARLGLPIDSGDLDTFLGEQVQPWDKYLADNVVVHVRYRADESAVDRITLLPAIEHQSATSS